ncbi:MAG: GNAT family N-acetyltransferase [Burkholderiaceae bacterium]|nr:GNAT family N-acetyltransferase [Burkholderiaceae bacterium]
MIHIRHYQPEDWQQLWPLLHATFSTGDTYTYAPDSAEAEIHQAWIETPTATYVVTSDDGTLLGSYKLLPNQVGLGSHVCNAGYVVNANARGQGIASALCQHSQLEAIKLGFRSMQFNMVVATNEVAVRLWQKHGFAIIGTLPEAYQHQTLGYVDAYVMFKKLVS